VIDHARRVSRLRDLLTSIQPRLERVTDPTQQGSQWLLSRYVTPTGICKAGRTCLIDYLQRAGSIPRRNVEQLAGAVFAIAKAQTLATAGDRLAVEVTRELRHLRERLISVDRPLAAMVEHHPHATLTRSLPRSGHPHADAWRRPSSNLMRRRPLPTFDNLASAAGRETSATSNAAEAATNSSTASSTGPRSARSLTQPVAPSATANDRKARNNTMPSWQSDDAE
jgi:hypothetical protein